MERLAQAVLAGLTAEKPKEQPVAKFDLDAKLMELGLDNFFPFEVDVGCGSSVA